MSYNKKQCGTVKISPIVPFIGIIGLIILSILLALSIHDKAGAFEYIVLGFFA